LGIKACNRQDKGFRFGYAEFPPPRRANNLIWTASSDADPAKRSAWGSGREVRAAVQKQNQIRPTFSP